MVRLRPILGDRTHWFAAIGSVSAANVLWSQSSAVHPVIWFALFAIAVIGFETASPEALRRNDFIIIIMLLAAILLPAPAFSALALIAAGGWLALTSQAGSRGRRVGAVLLGLTAPLIWGHVVFAAVGPELMAIDTRFASLISGTVAQGNLLSFNSDGLPMAVGFACSSLHNVTQAVLLWAAMTQLLKLPFSRASLLVCGGAIAANVLVNGLRLTVIAHNREDFAFWHLGRGGSMFAWGGVIAVLLVVVGGCHALAARRV